MANSIRIGDLLFDESTGEVFRLNEGGPELVGRLAPQPAELLSLMVANHPEITCHETIREKLWPGLSVDFEKSMHFCVRKIRSALGDSASAPKYIQTIPRRGYRFVEHVQIEALDAASGLSPPGDSGGKMVTELANTNRRRQETAGPRESLAEATNEPHFQPQRRKGTWRRWRSVAVPAVICLTFLLAIQRGHLGRTVDRPLRVAVMTFEPAEAASDLSLRNDIAEALVERLTNSGRLDVHVIGPTTTSAFDGDQKRLDDLIDEYDLDFLINGRFFTDSPGKLLAEVIRAEDRAHVWVHQMDPAGDHDAAANEVAAGFFNAVSNSTN